MSDAASYPITFGYKAVDGVYYGPNGSVGAYHRGEDRAMPNGTPVIVNGVTIGLSNNTGASSGPHLHIGRFVNGTDTAPNGGGFKFNSAVVSDVGNTPADGNYVFLSADGALWVYLHLQKQMVVKGQNLQGEEMIQDSDNEYSRWDKVATQIRGRHRGFTRDEFRQAAVGRTWLQALEILSDDPESDIYYSDSNLSSDDLNNLMGELGVPTPPNANDIEFHINQHDGHWKYSFYDLIQRKDRTRIPELRKTISDLQAQLSAAGGTIDPATQAKIDQIDQTTQSTNTIVQSIKDFLTKIFK